LRYDAHWLRQASGVHHHPRGPPHNHRTSAYAICSLSSCRLRSTPRYCTPLHRLGTGAFLGLLPFSAFIARHAEQGSIPAASRPQVFSTSRQERRPQRLAGLFHPAGTPRVTVSRGLNLIDRVLFPVPGSCAVILTFMASFRALGANPARLAAAPLRWRRPRNTQPLVV
jgi:hypothetical protein